MFFLMPKNVFFDAYFFFDAYAALEVGNVGAALPVGKSKTLMNTSSAGFHALMWRVKLYAHKT